jgi:uncharacterized cofD-like protein
LRIVSIGGGTGLSTLLHGLKPFTPMFRQREGRAAAPHPSVGITAVVTVTDDGGSSGRLRREFDVLPPGDIRNCMLALSEDEALLSRLFRYRFPSGRGLKGHSFGNLFLAALSHVTGDFAAAVKVTSEVLAICGRIYPSTAENVVLEARLENGSVVCGETQISRTRSRIREVRLKPSRCRPHEETLEAIAAADLITLGPGSLYTSVIPNLLVQGIPEAIARSAAVKAYFVNLMSQPRETAGHTASDHVRAVLEHSGCNLLDCVVLNNRPVSPVMRKKYAARRASVVRNDLFKIGHLGLTIIERDLLQEADVVRHDPDATAAVAMELARKGRARRSLEETTPRPLVLGR